MGLNTASEVISLSRQLEEAGARFYEELARRYPAHGEDFLSLARENKKNIVQIERAYYGVITDALEGGFAFNISQDEYALPTELAPETSSEEALARAIEMEEKMRRFYAEAAEQSRSLMADVPRVFAQIARKRDGRLSTLKALLA
ncbi:MAG TPA: hypothetical protein G4O01_03330 [Dehalococcoidia bacterium]|jgi:rubrerythrin|nr:hypothetical protein [Dehalococcoidia bacterium]